MKLSQFTNPLSGKTDSVFNFGAIWSLVLGVMVMFIVFALGQRAAFTVSSKLPGGIYPGLSSPVVKPNVTAASNDRFYGIRAA